MAVLLSRFPALPHRQNPSMGLPGPDGRVDRVLIKPLNVVQFVRLEGDELDAQEQL